MNEWLTSEEAARYLKINRRTLLEWARQGKLKAYKLSGIIRHVWRFRQKDLDDMLWLSSADGRCATTTGARPGIIFGMTAQHAGQS